MQKLKLALVGKRVAMLLVYSLKLCGLSWRRSVAPASPVWWQMRPSASSSGSPLLGPDDFFLLRRCQSMLLVPWLQTRVVAANPPPGR